MILDQDQIFDLVERIVSERATELSKPLVLAEYMWSDTEGLHMVLYDISSREYRAKLYVWDELEAIARRLNNIFITSFFNLHRFYRQQFRTS